MPSIDVINQLCVKISLLRSIPKKLEQYVMRSTSGYASIWCIFFHQLQQGDLMAPITRSLPYAISYRPNGRTCAVMHGVFGSGQNGHCITSSLEINLIIWHFRFALARKLSFLPSELDIFNIRQHYVRILFIFQRLIWVLLFLKSTNMNLAIYENELWRHESCRLRHKNLIFTRRKCIQVLRISLVFFF